MRAFFRFLRKLRFRYDPLVEIDVFEDRLFHNFKVFQEKNPGRRVAPVLKSNAYGHGLIPVAKMFNRRDDVPFLVVDSYFEALVLRNEGIRSTLLIVGKTLESNVYRNRLRDVGFTIVSMEELAQLSRHLTSPQTFHLKIDTGMHRQGIMTEELEKAITLVKKNKNIVIEGICSHLADAANVDPSFTLAQIHKWNEAVSQCRRAFHDVQYTHLAASAGAAYAESIDANAVRIGIGLYGINTNPNMELPLLPALEMRSTVSSVKTIGPGDRVGYGATFEAKEKMKIATVPVGYFEGIDRRLSNIGFLKWGDEFCPIAGIVSMNITTIGLPLESSVKAGDSVVVISKNREDKNSVENIAAICNTIPYVILVHIPQHLRRNVVQYA